MFGFVWIWLIRLHISGSYALNDNEGFNIGTRKKRELDMVI